MSLIECGKSRGVKRAWLHCWLWLMREVPKNHFHILPQGIRVENWQSAYCDQVWQHTAKILQEIRGWGDLGGDHHQPAGNQARSVPVHMRSMNTVHFSNGGTDYENEQGSGKKHPDHVEKGSWWTNTSLQIKHFIVVHKFQVKPRHVDIFTATCIWFHRDAVRQVQPYAKFGRRQTPSHLPRSLPFSFWWQYKVLISWNKKQHRL